MYFLSDINLETQTCIHVKHDQKEKEDISTSARLFSCCCCRRRRRRRPCCSI